LLGGGGVLVWLFLIGWSIDGGERGGGSWLGREGDKCLGWLVGLHLICVRRIMESPVLRGSSASKGLIELTMLILAEVVVLLVVVAFVVVVSRGGRSIDG
jgi:hypothetical protein